MFVTKEKYIYSLHKMAKLKSRNSKNNALHVKRSRLHLSVSAIFGKISIRPNFYLFCHSSTYFFSFSASWQFLTLSQTMYLNLLSVSCYSDLILSGSSRLCLSDNEYIIYGWCISILKTEIWKLMYEIYNLF